MSETKTEQPPSEPIRLSTAAIIDGLYFRAGSAVPFKTESDSRRTFEGTEADQASGLERLLTVDGKTGLSAAINLAAFCEDELGMVVLEIGPSPDPGANPTLDFRMEIAGRYLRFRIGLYGDDIRLAASVMDNVTPPQTLLRTRDDASGWQLVTRLVGALEQHEIKALHPRPLEVGPPGPTVLSSREGRRPEQKIQKAGRQDVPHHE